MVPGVFAGNISAEATTPTGNTFDEATRGSDLPMSAAQTETTVLDEKLYFQVFNIPAPNAPRRAAGAR